MKIIKKEIKNKNGHSEIRYIAEEVESKFDNTAQGYGYKSEESLQRAYWFFKNKNRLFSENNEAKRFLNENVEIKNELLSYFSEDNQFYAFKDGEELTMNDFVYYHINNETLKELLIQNKKLWKTLEFVVNNNKKHGGIL